MGKIISWLLAKFTKDILIISAYYVIMALYVTAVLAVYGSLVVAFFYFYDLVQTFLNMASGGGLNSGLAYIDYMYGLLDCIGITSAFNDTKSLIIGGIVFIFGRIAGQASIIGYKSLLIAITPMISK